MAGNSFGKAFNITTYGESHGVAIGVIIDGCPAGLVVDINFIQADLDKRRPGQSKITTQRKESDTVQILSGIFEGKEKSEVSRQIKKLIEKKMLVAESKGKRKYVIRFDNNYLLRSVIKILGEKGFLPDK